MGRVNTTSVMEVAIKILYNDGASLFY